MNENKLMLKKKTSGGDDVFFAATGVSDGDLLRGVRFEGGGRGRTQSMVMRAASGTVRTIETEHRWGQARAGKREVRRKSPGKVINFSSKQKNIKRAKKTHSLSLPPFPHRRSRHQQRRASRTTTATKRGGSSSSSSSATKLERTK